MARPSPFSYTYVSRFAWITENAVPGSYLAVIFSIIDDDYKLNALSIHQGRPGWHSMMTGAVSPLTECASIGDRTCPIYGTGFVNWRTNTKLAIVSKSPEIQLNNLYMIWSCCSYVTGQGSINHQLLKVCPPKPILEKMAEGTPVSPIPLVRFWNWTLIRPQSSFENSFSCDFS